MKREEFVARQIERMIKEKIITIKTVSCEENVHKIEFDMPYKQLYFAVIKPYGLELKTPFKYEHLVHIFKTDVMKNIAKQYCISYKRCSVKQNFTEIFWNTPLLKDVEWYISQEIDALKCSIFDVVISMAKIDFALTTAKNLEKLGFEIKIWETYQSHRAYKIEKNSIYFTHNLKKLWDEYAKVLKKLYYNLKLYEKVLKNYPDKLKKFKRIRVNVDDFLYKKPC